MPTSAIKFNLRNILDLYNDGLLPELPRRVVNKYLLQRPPYRLLRGIEDRVRPRRVRSAGSRVWLDYLAVAGAEIDEWDLILAAVFVLGDGASLMSTIRCSVCGDWGWWQGILCDDCAKR